MECDNEAYFVDEYDKCMVSVGDPAKDKPVSTVLNQNFIYYHKF